MNSILKYLKETREEMKNVKWPTKRQSINFTVTVIIVSVILAYYLGLFDYLFASGLRFIISK